jgi:hypothetical protein
MATVSLNSIALLRLGIGALKLTPTHPGAALRFLLTVATLARLFRAALSGFLDSSSGSPGESPCRVYRF